MTKPRFLICEDGDEYLGRLERFLGAHFEFVQSQDAASLTSELDHGEPVSAILLDLDFRRISRARLIDEDGHPLTGTNQHAREHFAANQGIAILSHLRRRGCTKPVLLFADIEDPKQQEYLQAKYRPLWLVSSLVGLHQLQGMLEQLIQGPQTESES